ncbi:MAG: two-component sensor histidine kinase, partial [Lachnospiraceae bacterium]|nr:two-component sensor histidine kinase [Lachnospiraceae bacterium]
MKLHRTLYLKLLLAYLLFFLLSFVMISTINSRMILNDLTRTRAESLYRESRLVATTYGNQLYSGPTARENALQQLKAIDTYISAEIRIIDSNGRQILDSRSSDNVVFDDFDPGAIGSYYLVSDFYGTYSEDHLSVFYPITSRYSVRGYVVIQMPMSDLYASRDRLLNISYLTMLFMYLLSLLVLVV